MSSRFLFKQYSVSAEKLSADSCARKYDVLKTYIYAINMFVLRTSNFQGATIRPIVPRHKHAIVFIVHQ